MNRAVLGVFWRSFGCSAPAWGLSWPLSTPSAGIGTRLKALAPQLHALLARYRATNLAVFGSVARDQALPDSDVDLLVDLPTGLSLFERADLKLALEDLLHHRVDLVRRRNLKPELMQRVEAEAIAI